MRPFVLALLMAAAVVFCEEASRAELIRGKSAEQWVALLGSEKFDEREEASKTLIAAGTAAEAALRKGAESSDQEVRLRAQLALSAIVSVSIEGDFLRVASESFSQNGVRTVQANESGESILTIRKGQVFFKQEYGKGIEQTYTFDEATPLKFKQKCSIELEWQSISVTTGYNPDSDKPKLECVNTPQGMRITLSATDTTGTSFKMVYAPKADVEKERAKEKKPQE